MPEMGVVVPFCTQSSVQAPALAFTEQLAPPYGAVPQMHTVAPASPVNAQHGRPPFEQLNVARTTTNAKIPARNRRMTMAHR